MRQPDYYQILGVARTADEAEIKRAYRRLAIQHHPDRNPGDKRAEERFKEISGAYDTLRNPRKRERYDRFGPAAHPRYTAGPSPFGGKGGLSDLFEQLFGDLFTDPAPRPERGGDLRFHLTVSLEEAARGVQKTLQVPRLEICPDCQGKGMAVGTRPQACPSCGGSGHHRRQHGFLTFDVPCRSCRGTGEFSLMNCLTCTGSGQVRQEKTLRVRVPAGVSEGTSLRLKAEGDAGLQGGAPGDLFVTMGLIPHDFFRRDDLDVHYTLNVSFVQAALGGEVPIPTLFGTTRMKVPAGTQAGRTFRLKGKGLPRMEGVGRGDQIVHVHVQTPTRLSREQQELLKEFARLEVDGQGSQARRGWRRWFPLLKVPVQKEQGPRRDSSLSGSG